LERAAAAGIGWPLPEGLSEEDLEARLFGNQPALARVAQLRPQPDWKTIHEQLQQHRHLTLQLLWEESELATPIFTQLSLPHARCYDCERSQQRVSMSALI
jgi:transposase